MRAWKLGGAAAGVLMAAGCASLLGLDDYQKADGEATSAGGFGGAATTSSGGTGGVESTNSSASGTGGAEPNTSSGSGGCTSGPIGVLGQACCIPGDVACAGHAQKQALLCNPDTLEWSSREFCAGKQLCDTIGVNTGSCQDPVPACVGKQAGDKVCDEAIVVECGPDLVTSVNTVCQNGTCDAGHCVCASPLSLCGNICKNLQVDSANCGACGNTCDAPDYGGGACESGHCPTTWSGWPMPNPVDAHTPNPASYDTSTPDVVLDNVTKLMWQRNVPSGLYEWADAKSYCTNLSLAGHDDWRLPNRIELISLVDYTRTKPAIDIAAFPNTPSTNWWFWSASRSDIYAWHVEFSTGSTDMYYLDDTNHVRCVR